MSEHLRRTAAVRAARTLLRAALPAAWAIGRARTAILRARWAWRCRGHPVIDAERDPLLGEDLLAFLLVEHGWKHTARTQGSRA
jgi:hypothetical protein